MNQRRALSLMIAVVVVVLGAGVAVMVWRPWNGCRAPGPLCSALRQIKASTGVVDADLSYTVTQRDPKDGDSARASWKIQLAADLSPTSAGQLAERVTRLAEDSRSPVRVDHFVELEAGRPTGSTVAVHPLTVIAGDDPSPAVAQAYTMWRAGASKAGSGGTVATDSRTLLKLAALAVDNGYRTSLSLADGSVRYETYDKIAIADLRLTVAAGALDHVENAIMTGDRSLTVHTTSADDSPQTADVLHWLKKRTPPSDRPTAFVLSSPGYAHLRKGWVGQQSPPAAKPHGVSLPDGVTPWPKDDSAPTCTGADLKITLTHPDAAAGTRYLAALARNTAAHFCALDGVPKLTFLNKDGDRQHDVTVGPAGEGVVARRIVIPAGQQALATLEWKAMATSQDPDVTTAIRITATPGATPVALTPRDQHGPTSLDILDGADVAVGPWAQAVDGWSVP